MNHPAPHTADRDGVLRYRGDGLGDLFLGLILVEAGAILADASNPFSGLFLILVPLLFWAKRSLVAPRLSRSDLRARPSGSIRRRAFAWGGSATALLLAAAAVLRFATEAARPWGLVFLAGVGIVAQIGLRTGAERFVLYAVAAALLIAGHAAFGAPRLEHALAILGLTVAAVGTVLFIHFLRHHPPTAETHL